jgi:fucose permease
MDPLQLIGISAVLLCSGLVGLVWTDGVNLSFLNGTSLAAIEKQHPHLPSLRIIAGIVLCSAVLLATSHVPLKTLTLFAGWDEWIHPTTFFVTLCSLGIIGELKWRGAGDYAFAFTAATAISFLIAVLAQAASTHFLRAALPLVALLGGTLIVAWVLFFHSWNRRVQIVALITFLFWIAVFWRG